MLLVCIVPLIHKFTRESLAGKVVTEWYCMCAGCVWVWGDVAGCVGVGGWYR